MPLGTVTKGTITGSYQSIFDPADFTFALWIVINIFLLVFIISQLLLPGSHELSRWIRNKTGILFALSCILQSLWYMSKHMEYYDLALIFILGLTFRLFILYKKLSVVKQTDFFKKLIIDGFSLYLGFASMELLSTYSLMIQTMENLYLDYDLVTICLIMVATLMAIAFIVYEKNHIYAAAVLWTLFGIFFKNMTDTNEKTAMMAAAIGIGFIIISMSLTAEPGKHKSFLHTRQY